MWSYFIQEGNIVLASPMDKNRNKQAFHVKNSNRIRFKETENTNSPAFVNAKNRVDNKSSTSASRNPDISRDNSIWM